MIKINSHELGRVLKALLLTAGKNDIRYYLNGVLFRYEGNELTIVATEGSRCAIAKMRVETDDNKSDSFIIPRDTVARMVTRDGILHRIYKNVDVEITGHSFKFASTTITVDPISGVYPKYERVMPNMNCVPPETMLIDPSYLKDMGDQFKIIKADRPIFRMTEQTVHYELRKPIDNLLSFQSFIMQMRLTRDE